MTTNKIIYGNDTLIDLTGDTATASDVIQGKTFHSKEGTQIIGTKVDVTPISITPSLSAPFMYANNVYKPTVDGYAIRTYTNVNPSDDDSGTYFSSGFVKMSSSGYAYKNKPSGGMTETVLWTNSNPTASTGFAAQNVTLSDNINNYDFIAVKCAHGIQTAQQSNYSKAYFKVSDYIVSYAANGSPVCSVTFLYLKSNRTMAIRHFWYINDYTLHFEVGIVGNSAGASANNQYAIPLYVYGCK